MRTFTINGVTYTAKKFNFNTICDFEERGISLDSIAEHPMTFMRVYLAMCCGKSVEFAGDELENHLINGGTFEDLMNIVQLEMDESGFFQALNKGAEKNTTKSKKTTAQK